MARTRKPRPDPLGDVEPGDVFAMPLGGGRWGACRVLQKRADPLQVLVQASPWVGDAPPADLSDPLLLAPLVKTHHHWNNSVERWWVSDPLPAELVRLGRAAVTRQEARVECDAYGVWESLILQPLLQWRWDHEREAVLAEDARDEAEREAERHEARYRYQPSPTISLRERRGQVPFDGWSGFVEPENVRRSRRIARDLIDELIAVEGDEVRMFGAFRRAVERFNEADMEDGFIMTIEREDICELLGDLADAVGLTDYEVCAWRDW